MKVVIELTSRQHYYQRKKCGSVWKLTNFMKFNPITSFPRSILPRNCVEMLMGDLSLFEKLLTINKNALENGSGVA
ncbi:hypothetical protein RCL_jg27709.t1 [Rhizophagus clarus]|uniref:Uncharacterized protein n=1 Tax=Rhizophagus clarus TaxID=94130 RepID=A0A8H3R4C2_9GLOM|nr:hypothetical protein RCL_jg27709.t1 [Rhizophagus clarus]